MPFVADSSLIGKGVGECGEQQNGKTDSLSSLAIYGSLGSQQNEFFWWTAFPF